MLERCFVLFKKNDLNTNLQTEKDDIFSSMQRVKGTVLVVRFRAFF